MKIANLILVDIYHMVRVLRRCKRYTDKLGDRIYKFVWYLPRMGRAMFWKVWNYYDKALSEAWYMPRFLHKHIILDSLVCHAPQGSPEHQRQCAQLDYVCHFQPALKLPRRGWAQC